eukprot:jgi/Psemu1/307327/fgenesh1_kg.321_\
MAMLYETNYDRFEKIGVAQVNCQLVLEQSTEQHHYQQPTGTRTRTRTRTTWTVRTNDGDDKNKQTEPTKKIRLHTTVQDSGTNKPKKKKIPV